MENLFVFIIVWGLLSIVFINLYVYMSKHAEGSEEYCITVKDILFFILILPITLVVLLCMGIYYIIEKIEQINIVRHISEFLNKPIKISKRG